MQHLEANSLHPLHLLVPYKLQICSLCRFTLLVCIRHTLPTLWSRSHSKSVELGGGDSSIEWYAFLLRALSRYLCGCLVENTIQSEWHPHSCMGRLEQWGIQRNTRASSMCELSFSTRATVPVAFSQEIGVREAVSKKMALASGKRISCFEEKAYYFIISMEWFFFFVPSYCLLYIVYPGEQQSRDGRSSSCDGFSLSFYKSLLTQLPFLQVSSFLSHFQTQVCLSMTSWSGAPVLLILMLVGKVRYVQSRIDYYFICQKQQSECSC